MKMKKFTVLSTLRNGKRSELKSRNIFLRFNLRSMIILPKYMAPPTICSARVRCDPLLTSRTVGLRLNVNRIFDTFSQNITEKIVLDTVNTFPVLNFVIIYRRTVTNERNLSAFESKRDKSKVSLGCVKYIFSQR